MPHRIVHYGGIASSLVAAQPQQSLNLGKNKIVSGYIISGFAAIKLKIDEIVKSHS